MALHTPAYRRSSFTLLCSMHCVKDHSLLFQLRHGVNVGSSAFMPEGLWMPLGLIPADQKDCPCLMTAHTYHSSLPSHSVIPMQTPQQEMKHVKQLFLFQISIISSVKFTWNSSERWTSWKMNVEMPFQTPVLTLLMEILTTTKNTTRFTLVLFLLLTWCQSNSCVYVQWKIYLLSWHLSQCGAQMIDKPRPTVFQTPVGLAWCQFNVNF